MVQIKNWYALEKGYLPIVVTIVLYHGKDKFDFPNFAELYLDYGDDTKNYIPQFKVEFFDLYRYGEEYINKVRSDMSLVMLLGMLSNVYKNEQQMLKFVEWFIDRYGEQLRNTQELIEMMLLYLGRFRRFVEKGIIEKVMELVLTEIDYEPGSLIDKLLKEGEERGIKISEERGSLKTLKTAVKRMLKKGFDDDTIKEALGVDQAFIDMVKKEMEQS